MMTNADRVRSMTDEEISQWFWDMLFYTKGFTDSRVALDNWLKQDYTGGFELWRGGFVQDAEKVLHLG